MTVVTPEQVENQLRKLSKQIDECHGELMDSEKKYYEVKAKYEIELARTRLDLAGRSSPSGRNYTVQEREDMALIKNYELHVALAISEAEVRAARANSRRLETQVDIARSISVSVRAGMDL